MTNTQENPFPKKLIVPNQNLSFITLPRNPTRIGYIDISNNPIKLLSNLPKLNNLEKIQGDNTQILSFQGVVEQPHLTSVSFLNTPIVKNKYFKLMASIAFGHALKIVNDEPLSIRDLDEQLRYGPIIRKFLVQGYVIEKLTPTIILRNVSDGSIMNLLYKPSKSFFDIDQEEEDVDEIILNSFKPSHRRCRRDPVDILRYHKANLARFQSTDKTTKVPFPSPTKKVGIDDISANVSQMETDSMDIFNTSSQQNDEIHFKFSDNDDEGSINGNVNE